MTERLSSSESDIIAGFNTLLSNYKAALARLREAGIMPVMTAASGDRIAGWSTPVVDDPVTTIIKRLRAESKRRKESWNAHPRKHDADVKLGEWSALQEMAEVLEREQRHAHP